MFNQKNGILFQHKQLYRKINHHDEWDFESINFQKNIHMLENIKDKVE